MIPRSRRALLPLLPAFLLVTLAGCGVRRELSVQSDPPGALVYLNDQEFGRTPVTRPFTFYGTYDVVARKEGYQTLKTSKEVIAPWWQWVPFDLVAELFPLTDRREITLTLKPADEGPADPDLVFQHAAELKSKLPATQPVTKPSTQP